MKLVVIAHNIRSAYNIGSILRTADGAGVSEVYLTGYSPVPAQKDAPYLTSAQKMISKTALGAEKSVYWKKVFSIGRLLEKLKQEGFKIVALEQHEKSLDYDSFRLNFPIALIIGNEPKGIDSRILKKSDFILEIPMRGKKKSLNVAVAFGIMAYKLGVEIKNIETI